MNKEPFNSRRRFLRTGIGGVAALHMGLSYSQSRHLNYPDWTKQIQLLKHSAMCMTPARWAQTSASTRRECAPLVASIREPSRRGARAHFFRVKLYLPRAGAKLGLQAHEVPVSGERGRPPVPSDPYSCV